MQIISPLEVSDFKVKCEHRKH